MGLAGPPEIRRGDHACCVFASEDEQVGLLAPFARNALARGDALLYLADRADEHAVVSILDEAGLDGRALLYSGAAKVLHSSQMGLEGGFDRERQMAVWDSLVAQARNDGFGGLAVAAEMSWALSWDVDADALIEYEAAAAPAFASGELSALCQYDARLFDREVLTRSAHAHAYALSPGSRGWSIDYLRLHLVRGDEPGTLAVGGEIDLTNVEFLEAQLHDQLSSGDVVADCSTLTFVDVAGCRVLRRACVGEMGSGRLTLENAPAILTRVMNICSWADWAG